MKERGMKAKDLESKFDLMDNWFFKWTQMSTTVDASLGKFYKKKGYEICGIHEEHFFGRKAVILSKFF